MDVNYKQRTVTRLTTWNNIRIANECLVQCSDAFRPRKGSDYLKNQCESSDDSDLVQYFDTQAKEIARESRRQFC